MRKTSKIKYFLSRTIAYMVDSIIAFSAVMLVIQWVILRNIRPYFGITDEWFHESWNVQAYVFLTISLPVWIYFSFFDSKKSKGTFGKRIFKLAVVDNTGNRIPFSKSFIRTFLKLLPWEISHIGVIFPTPMYFETEADLRLATYLGVLLFVIYVLSILLDKSGIAIYDKLLQTKVIVKKGTPSVLA